VAHLLALGVLRRRSHGRTGSGHAQLPACSCRLDTSHAHGVSGCSAGFDCSRTKVRRPAQNSCA
jgi:hypothetical protein